MRELVEYIVKQLCTKPEAVSVEESEGEDGVDLLVTVDQADMGLVIGKSGQTIKAIRKILLVRAISEGKRVNLRLNEPEGVSDSQTEDAGEKQHADSTRQSAEEQPV